MKPYTALCAHVLFPLHERLKHHDSVAVRQRLEASQWWPADRLEDDRVQRMRAFLTDIGRHVPYFRTLFQDHGFDPAQVRSIDALRALPVHGKAEMRAQAGALMADDHGAMTRYNTGGSSGEPLIFHMGKARKSHDVAAKWRATRWWGVDIGDTELVVWGSPIELGAQDRVKQLRDRILRSHLLPAFEMSPTNLDRFVREIRQRRPAMLFGYPSSLSLIAAHAEQRGVSMRDLGVRVAFVTSERLYDHQRSTIERVFGCPVANGYGARDAGFIAHQCPAGQLHISAEDIIVETLRPDNTPCAKGEAGEIVVTHLATRDFPFLRYRTGDVGVLGGSGCACGRTLPVLAEVQGRSTDFVVARDGTVLHGLALIYTVRDLPGVERFRIEQVSLDKTVVQVVAGSAFDAAAERRIQSDFRSRLGAEVDIRVERVPAIPAEASGKYRYVVSRVAPSGRSAEPQTGVVVPP